MLTKQTLEEFLKDQWNVLVDLNISIRNMSRLKVDKYEYDVECKKHGFFRHHWYQLKFIAVIQLAKLVSSRKNDLMSIPKLCNLLRSAPYHESLVNHLASNKGKAHDLATSREDIETLIIHALSELDSNQIVIVKILDARDKLYAHKDPNASVPYISSEELLELIRLLSTLHNNFSYKIFHSKTVFDLSDDWDIDYVLWYMTEVRKMDAQDQERKKSSGPQHRL